MEDNISAAKGFLSHGLESQETCDSSYTQPERELPLFMQRPQSSGIDLTAFSFAKPVTRSKGYTLQEPPTHPLNPTPLSKAVTSKLLNKPMLDSNQSLRAKEE